ncbi:MAG TPA: PqqD family protein [Longimicrobiales bacterium]|nr:PqqD family protein [Longimicrobiales bacterium]
MLRRLKAWVQGSRPEGPAPDAKLRPARDVLEAERDGLIVLLDLRREVYLGLDEVGTAVWRSLGEGARVDELVARVAAAYDAPRDVIERDTTRFIHDLATRRLVLHS